MSADATGWTYRHSPFTGSTQAVLLAMADSVNDQHDNEFWMTQGRLAAKARVTRQTANNALEVLVKEKFIEDLGSISKGNKVRKYRFLFPDVPVLFESRRLSPQTTTRNQVVTTDDNGLSPQTTTVVTTDDTYSNKPKSKPNNTTDTEKDFDPATSLAAFKQQSIDTESTQDSTTKSKNPPPNSAAPPLDNPQPTNVYTLEDIYESFCRGSGHRPEAPSEIAQWKYQCKPFLRITSATPDAVEAAAKRQDEQWDPQYPRTPASLYKNWGKLYRKPKSKAKVTLVDHEPWMDQVRATFPVPEGHEDWYERNQAVRQANLAANGGVFKPFD